MLISFIFDLEMKSKDKKTLLPVGMNRYTVVCECYRTDSESHSPLLKSQQKPPTSHTCQKYFNGQMHNLNSQMTNTDGGNLKVLSEFWLFCAVLEEDWPYGGFC